MAKFPSQRKLTYDITGIDDATMTTSGLLNLPKDLSILNRRGYASTTRKGVPLIFKAKVDFYLQDDLGQGPSTAYNADAIATMKLTGMQNNWVTRNAAVKWHAAREAMFDHAQIKKSQRGAYSHEIRYNYHTADDTSNWLIPIDADGNAFNGGTWDHSDITTDDDASIALKLVGPSDIAEEGGATGSVLNIAHAYLMSRSTVHEDTNVQMEETPAKFSVLEQLLNPRYQVDGFKDEVISEARHAQDNPPYELLDVSDSSDLNHDLTESVELGRATAEIGRSYGSMIVEIPFGLCDVRTAVQQAASSTLEPNGLMCVEVLDIFEMQG